MTIRDHRVQRRQLRRSARRRRRGGVLRGPRVVQRAAGRLVDAGAEVRTRLVRAARGDRPLALVLVGVLVLGGLVLAGPAQSYLDARARVDQLRATVDALDTANAELRGRVEDLNDPVRIELIAREQQGYARPGEVAYTLTPPEVERPRITSPPGAPPPDGDPTWFEQARDVVVGWLPGSG